MEKQFQEEKSESQNHNIVKRRSGEKLEGKEKQIIFNVFNYLRSKNPERSISRTVEDTAEATGCSTQTIFRIRKEAITGTFRSPSKTKPRKKINKNSRLIKYDDVVRSIIRSKVHDSLFNNLPLTLNSVLSIVNQDPDLPNFKRSTLHKVLNEMGFTYEKKGKNAMYVENANLINSRHSYLRDIRRYRLEKRSIIFTGETTVEAGAINKKNIEDLNSISNEIFADDPSGVGIETKSPMVTYTIIQAGNETGFIKDGDLVYLCDKKITQEDEETDCSRFEDWAKNRLLTSIPPSSIIVVDNSSYHRWKSDPIPDKTWQRDRIKEWLTSKRISYKDELLKKDLLDIVANVKHKYSGFQVEEIARSYGHTVLKLPLHHCELSPLGPLWRQVKQYVSIHTAVLKSEEFDRIIWEALRCVSIDNWRMQIEAVLKVEQNIWRADTLQETLGKEAPNNLVATPVVSEFPASREVPLPQRPIGNQRDSAEQAHWFSDFMRLRAGEGYHQYFEDRQQSNFDMVK